MAFKDGSLQQLIDSDEFTARLTELTSILFHQMLMALDCLAWNNIIHRDIKPDNILYSCRSDSYHFQLSDFGLSNEAIEARTFAGSLLFMAPEILDLQEKQQTPKVDTWSLFVTMAYAINADGFRYKNFKPNSAIVKAVLQAARDPHMEPIKEMAIVDPNKRASAAHMLVKAYKGKGLTTPRESVLALDSKSKHNAGRYAPAADLHEMKAARCLNGRIGKRANNQPRQLLQSQRGFQPTLAQFHAQRNILQRPWRVTRENDRQGIQAYPPIEE